MKILIKSKTLSIAVVAAIILSGCTAAPHSSEILDTQSNKGYQESQAVSNEISDSPSDSAQDKALDSLIYMPERELIEKILRAEAGDGSKEPLDNLDDTIALRYHIDDILPEKNALQEDTPPENPPAYVAENTSKDTSGFSQESLDQMVSDVLDSIITDGMSKREQAYAVFKYTNKKVRYVGDSIRSSWQEGAYEGLTTGRGDCYTYYALSRALLTALGIDNLEVTRVGGSSDHYWNLVNCGDGWYHFDAGPHNVPMGGPSFFMFTDQEAADYTAKAGRNYYDFDSSLYPARAGGEAAATQNDEDLQEGETETPAEEMEPPQTDEREPELPAEDGSASEPLIPSDTDVPVSRDMEQSIEAINEEGL